MPLLIEVGHRLDYAFQECLGSAKDPSGKRMDHLLRKLLLRVQQVTQLLLLIILIKQGGASNDELPGIESKHFFILVNFKDQIHRQLQLSSSHLFNLFVTLVRVMKSLYSLLLCYVFTFSPSLEKLYD